MRNKLSRLIDAIVGNGRWLNVTSRVAAAGAGVEALYAQHRNALGKMLLYEAQGYEPMSVDATCSDETLTRMLDHIATVWTRLGDSEPHWSVVTAPQFKAENISNTLDDFYATGEREAQALDRLLARVGVEPVRGGTALEYGCGVGRLTVCLATRFSKVVGVDISERHLEIARQQMDARSLANVSFVRVSHLASIRDLPRPDFIYSKIVLQHNPPPVMRFILDQLLSLLQSGGAMVVQLPTYCRGYTFSANDYLASMYRIDKMEMHALPQREVLDLTYAHGCRVRDVTRDHLVSSMDFVSNTFVIEKP